MHPERKELLLKALTSGEYTQGKGILKSHPKNSRTECFCIVGVMCDLFLKHAQEYGHWAKQGFTGTETQYGFYYHSTDPETRPVEIMTMIQCPSPVKRWFGITDQQTARWPGENDEGRTFEQFAEEIRTL